MNPLTLKLIGAGVIVVSLLWLVWSWHSRGETIEDQKNVIENYKLTEKLTVDNQAVDNRVNDVVKKRKEGLNEIKPSECGIGNALRYAHDSVYE